MTGGALEGLRVVEGSAFVAAPLGGMTLAQLGADVIRFDHVDGGVDSRRWPVDDRGRSLFWRGLNKGKRSIALDLANERGRELAVALATAPGEGGGLFLTNFPARDWLSYERLVARRDDLIMAALSGNPDGSSEVDYTVHPATGFPAITGPRELAPPVNSVIPAWDIAMGELAALGLLAAVRHRDRTGEGQLVELALSDVAFAMVANLGLLAEAQLSENERPRDGNHLYGAFGHSFRTADARYVMVVALTARQWRALRDTTEIAGACEQVERLTGEDLGSEAGRFATRDLLVAILTRWFSERTLAEVRRRFEGSGVCWSPYQTFRQLLREDPRCSEANPMFSVDPQNGALTPSSPLRFSQSGRPDARRTPQLGEHTEEILGDVLRLTDGEIGRLHADGVVAWPHDREERAAGPLAGRAAG